MRRLGHATAPGFTLVECMTACAVAAVLAAVAVPSYRHQTLRSARLDAVSALTKLQAAQELHRVAHGLYAADLGALGPAAAAISPQGHYRLTLSAQGPDAYTAVATATGAQAQDRSCPELRLEVASGFAHEGPSAGCWQR